jgi:hypothetical protein
MAVLDAFSDSSGSFAFYFWVAIDSIEVLIWKEEPLIRF